MKRDFLQPLYICFDTFLEKYIISKNSFITNEINILSENNINEAITCFVDNFDDSDSNFEEKVARQFEYASLQGKLNFVHAEWLWCFSVGDISQWRKEDYINRRINLEAHELQPNIFPIAFGHAGQWHTNNKYWEIVFCLRLLKVLDAFQSSNNITDILQLKNAIEEFCNYVKYDQELQLLVDFESVIEPIKGRKYAMSNILLYITFPEKYERIASDNHKNRIVNSFHSLENEGFEELTIDQRIYQIRKEVSSLINEIDFDFYEHPIINKVWNMGDDEIDFDELQALLFKKAVVFYGPPGTSKTYKAKELASSFILNSYIKDKSRLDKYLSNPVGVVKNRIHHLQLHANYTYENFIGGYLLKNGDTVLTKGSFFNICESARKDLNSNPNLDIPHVLILDEMNRVDLSKLFGEVFSALEQRDCNISIGIEDLVLNVPRNLHIIGTMNEIDFSVEQIDFALRRRFLWFFYGYKEYRLKEIINHRAESTNSKIQSEDLDRYFRNITNMNNRIVDIEELGKMYQIGHAFFGDVVAIYDQYRSMKGYVRKTNILFEDNGPVHIIWNISIQPILDAFMGNIEDSNKDSILKELKTIFIR